MKITAWTILSDKSTVFALLICMVGTFDITYWSGFISVELAQMGMNGNYVGYVLGAQSVTYIVACLIYPYTIEHSPRMLQFAVCLLGYALCNLLLGPSLWLHFPDSVWLPVLSFPIQGVMQVLVFIPVLPEMIERMQVKLKISEGEDEILDGQLNDKINDPQDFEGIIQFFSCLYFVNLNQKFKMCIRCGEGARREVDIKEAVTV